MVIYGEYLFLENLITGMIILFFTGKTLGEKVHPFRMILCGICCGAYGFILFTTIQGIISILGKLLFSIAMVTLAFGKKTLKRTLQNSLIFFVITVLYGGLAIAMITSFGLVGVTAATGIYFPPLTYLSVTAVAAGSAWIIDMLLILLRTKRMEKRTTAVVKMTVDGCTWFMKGLIDSGNALCEPLTGKPVCIVRRDLMDEILKGVELPERRYAVIPYRTIGVDCGVLEGYRVDNLVIEGEKETQLLSPVLAICEEQSFFQEEKDLEILLPGSILERGIDEYDQ